MIVEDTGAVAGAGAGTGAAVAAVKEGTLADKLGGTEEIGAAAGAGAGTGAVTAEVAGKVENIEGKECLDVAVERDLATASSYEVL